MHCATCKEFSIKFASFIQNLASLNKTELLKKLQEIAREEDLLKVRNEFKTLQESLAEIQASEREAQLMAFIEDGGTAADFEPPVDDFERDVKAAKDLFKERMNQFLKKKKDDELKNLEEKKVLIARIRLLIENEENIGKAFTGFKEIQEEWKDVGLVPREKTREVQQAYSEIIETFYYNINIYRELQANDLKKNLSLREEVIQKVANLEKEKSIKQVEILLPAFTAEWDNSGPVGKDDWDRLRTQFWEEVGKQNLRISEHYKAKRENQKENQEKKEALLEETKLIASKVSGVQKASEWEKLSNAIKEIQKKWKDVGFSGKKEGERIWKEFRATCDELFKTKTDFYGEVKKEQKGVKASKLKLIERVASIKDSDSWKDTTIEIVRIQKDWKKLGSAHPRDERKLWTDFRSACDHFFKRKEAHYASLKGAKKENVGLKEAKIKELATFKGGSAEDMETFKQLLVEYHKIGPVEDSERDRLIKSFHKERDAKLKTLGLKKDEEADFIYNLRLDGLSNGQNALSDLQKEKRNLEDRIKKLDSERLQYENNLGFFAHVKDDNPMKAEVLGKVKDLEDQKKDQLSRISLVKKKIKSLQEND